MKQQILAVGPRGWTRSRHRCRRDGAARPARMIAKNEREPGGRAGDRDVAGGELENEPADLADAFAARFTGLTL